MQPKQPLQDPRPDKRDAGPQPPSQVLFVDDDPLVRSAIARSIQRETDCPFAARFAADGEEALALLDASEVDVIVTDMIMPRMDGAALLAEVRRRWPTTIRIVLTGQMGRALKVKALPVAHLLLHKPCPFPKLRDHVTRAGALRRRLAVSGLSVILERVDRLPSTPKLYTELTDVMGDESAGLHRISGIVDRDPAIAARLLQLANSAWVGLPRRVGTTRDALRVLGLDLLRKLVLTAEVFEAFERLQGELDLSSLRSHSVATARIAGHIVSGDLAPEATTAALLHDVGKLALAKGYPRRYARVLATAAETGRPLHAVERQQLGCDHADAGAALLDLWGLPLPALHAVGDHHSPGRLKPGQLDTPGAVYAANLLAGAALEGRVWELARNRAGIDDRWAAPISDATLTRWAATAERVIMDQRNASEPV